MALAIERIFRESLPAPVYSSSGPAILGCPLIYCQWPVGYDVLTNVAIVVMYLVGLAPASVEQRNARRHSSCVSRLRALGNAHQRVDGDRRLLASECLHLGNFLRSSTRVAALAFLECAWSAHLILTCSEVLEEPLNVCVQRARGQPL